jgi:hypothetical protein
MVGYVWIIRDHLLPDCKTNADVKCYCRSVPPCLDYLPDWRTKPELIEFTPEIAAAFTDKGRSRPIHTVLTDMEDKIIEINEMIR